MTALVPSLRSIALVALLALGRVPLAAQSGPEVARAFREANEVSILRDFTELLSYPNRARDTEDIRRAAAYIRDELLAVGVNSELLEIEGALPWRACPLGTRSSNGSSASCGPKGSPRRSPSG